LLLLFADQQPQCSDSDCGHSAIDVWDNHRLEVTIDGLATLTTLALIAAVVAVLFRRWRGAGPARRRVLGPVYLASSGALVILVLENLLASLGGTQAGVLSVIFFVLFAAVPFAFLFGILRSRLAYGSVSRLVLAIGQGTPAREAIAVALGDPSLELAFPLEAGPHLVTPPPPPPPLPPAHAATPVSPL